MAPASHDTKGDAAESDSPASGPTPLADPVGSVIAGRYRIERLLGRGGMGEVYLAIQQPIERQVALKLMSPERKTKPRADSQFLDEARAVSRLKSPHTVTVYDETQARASSAPLLTAGHPACAQPQEFVHVARRPASWAPMQIVPALATALLGRAASRWVSAAGPARTRPVGRRRPVATGASA